MPADSAIDTSGQALVALSNGVNANLEWRINCSYRNEINIWGENGSLYTARIFSKQSNYLPLFYLKDMQGNESEERGVAGDHFQFMFQEFIGTISDHKKVESERIQIMRRAVLMDQIWSLGRLQ